MRESTASKVPLPSSMAPILCSIPQASAMLGRGVGAIYGLIGDGEILAVKSARRTLVVVDSLHKYAAKLKPAKSDRAIASRNVSVWG